MTSSDHNELNLYAEIQQGKGLRLHETFIYSKFQ